MGRRVGSDVGELSTIIGTIFAVIFMSATPAATRSVLRVLVYSPDEIAESRELVIVFMLSVLLVTS